MDELSGVNVQDLIDGGKLTFVLLVLFWALTKGWLATKPHIQALLDIIAQLFKREEIRDAQIDKLTEAVNRSADILDEFRKAIEEKR
jgi:hypothetical protein